MTTFWHIATIHGTKLKLSSAKSARYSISRRTYAGNDGKRWSKQPEGDKAWMRDVSRKESTLQVWRICAGAAGTPVVRVGACEWMKWHALIWMAEEQSSGWENKRKWHDYVSWTYDWAGCDFLPLGVTVRKTIFPTVFDCWFIHWTRSPPAALISFYMSVFLLYHLRPATMPTEQFEAIKFEQMWYMTH